MDLHLLASVVTVPPLNFLTSDFQIETKNESALIHTSVLTSFEHQPLKINWMFQSVFNTFMLHNNLSLDERM